MESRRHFSYTLIEFYRDYKKAKKAEGIKISITYNEYKKVITHFIREVYRGLIDGSLKKFRLPYALGVFHIKSFKPKWKKQPVNFGESKRQGKLVNFLNLHTFGYFYGLYWDKIPSRFANSTYYRFRAARSASDYKEGVGRKALSEYIIKASKGEAPKPDYMKH